VSDATREALRRAFAVDAATASLGRLATAYDGYSRALVGVVAGIWGRLAPKPRPAKSDGSQHRRTAHSVRNRQRKRRHLRLSRGGET
jgi:hypothetical protein